MNRRTKSDVTISSLTTSTSVESNSSLSTSSHRGVLLLSVLKSPNLSNYSHKGKIAKNLPVSKKRTNSNFKSNPKTIKPQQRVTECSKEPFTVSFGKLFCQRCRTTEKSSIEYHIKYSKHNDEKKTYNKGKLITLILRSP